VADLSQLDLLIIQIDGMHMDNDLTLVGAVGIDGAGDKHPLGVIEGATENAAVVHHDSTGRRVGYAERVAVRRRNMSRIIAR